MVHGPQMYGAQCSIQCSCTVHSPQSVLLKADTGADANLMNSLERPKEYFN